MSSQEPAPPIPIERLLPHRAPVLVVEEVLEASPLRSLARLRLRPEGLYFERGRFVPVWAIEIMAQGLAAGLGLAGGPQRAQGAFGYLVGVDGFAVPGLEALVPQAELRVEARLEADIPPVVECAVELVAGSMVAARARLRLLMGVGALASPPARAEGVGSAGLQVVGNAAGRVEASLVLSAAHPYLQGHFPRDPVLPAIGHLRLVEEALEAATGRKRWVGAIDRARFQLPVRPGQSLLLVVESNEDALAWSLKADGQLASCGRGFCEC